MIELLLIEAFDEVHQKEDNIIEGQETIAGEIVVRLFA